MKGLQDYSFKSIRASSLVGVKTFMHFFYALYGDINIRHFGVWTGLEGGFIPESCKSCRVLCAICLRLIGLLGLNTE